MPWREQICIQILLTKKQMWGAVAEVKRREKHLEDALEEQETGNCTVRHLCAEDYNLKTRVICLAIFHSHFWSLLKGIP